MKAKDGPSRLWSGARKLGIVILAIGAYSFVYSIDLLLGTSAPEVTTSEAGALLFHLGPRYVPAVAPVLAAALAIIIATGLWKKKEKPDGPAKRSGRLSRIVRSIALAFVLLLIAVILLIGIAADARAYRSVVVTDDVVELRSIFSTQRLQRADIQRAEIHREQTSHRGRPAEILSFEIVDGSGDVHRSWYSGSSAVGFEAVLERLEAELGMASRGDEN